jgi:uncharacterized Ntn-hydrolase superfamily protein
MDTLTTVRCLLGALVLGTCAPSPTDSSSQALPQGPVAPAAVAFDETGTFSIVARDPAAGELGVGVQSKAFAVGSRVPTVKGGLVAMAHQAQSNPMYGALGVELLATGMAPQQTLDILARGDDQRDRRQVAMIDSKGRTAAWTGPAAQEWKGHRCGVDYCVQGNILAGPQVVEAMAKSFESTTGPLAERMLAALDAAQTAGGDVRGAQSAALVVAKPLAGAAGFSDRIVDLRVDDSRAPLVELRRLLTMLRANQLAQDSGERLAKGQVSDALQLATAASERSPENDVAWLAVARAAMAAGDRRRTLEALSRAIDLNPANRGQIAGAAAFESLRGDEAFRKLVGAADPPRPPSS